MSLPARLQMDRPGRITLDRAATLRDISREPFDVVVDNISSTGCLVSTDAELADDMLVTIGIAGLGTRSARVARQEPSGYGLAFVEPATETEVMAARTAETLVDGAFAPLPTAELSDEITLATAPLPDDRLSRRARFLFITGSSMALWAVIGFGIIRFALS